MVQLKDARQFHYFRVDNRIISDYGPLIGANGIAVYCCLARHADNSSRSARPSYGTIARELGLARRTVMRLIERLCDLRLLEKESRSSKDGVRLANRYILLDPPKPDLFSELPGGGGGVIQTPGSVTGDTGGGVIQTPGSVTRAPGTIPRELDSIGLDSCCNSSNGTPEQANRKPDVAAAAEPLAVPKAEENEIHAAHASEPARALAAEIDKGALVAALKDRGLPGSIAQRYVRTFDPALIREALVYQSEASRLENPVGALRSMIDSPEEWGFERTPTGWQRPPPFGTARASKPPTEAELREKMRREEEACQKALEEAQSRGGLKTFSERRRAREKRQYE